MVWARRKKKRNCFDTISSSRLRTKLQGKIEVQSFPVLSMRNNKHYGSCEFLLLLAVIVVEKVGKNWKEILRREK